MSFQKNLSLVEELQLFQLLVKRAFNANRNYSFHLNCVIQNRWKSNKKNIAFKSLFDVQ